MKLSDRNSQQASDYAAKRKEQLERANKLRKEREAQSVAKQMASLDINSTSVGGRGGSCGEHGYGLQITPSSTSSRGGVSTTSYADPRTGASVAERIVIGREALGFHDPWESPGGGGMGGAPPAVRAPAGRIVASSSRRTVPADDDSRAVVSHLTSSNEFLTETPNDNHDLSVNSETYFSSPLDPAGTLYDVSAMPVLCMSSRGGEVVVGCADHALYAVNVSPAPGERGRAASGPSFTTMYGKKHGHSDWITGVCHLADGRVLSCGMDNRLCLWNGARSSCIELPNGHERSISKVVSDTYYNVALSCGYDGNIMAWAFGTSNDGSRRGTGRATGGVLGPAVTLYGHKSPVVECIFKGPTVASGTKEGSLFFWDLPTGTLLNKHRAHKNGAVTALEQVPNSPLFVSGGSDGVLKLWDPRSAEGARGSVARVDVHASSARSTTGVVTCVACLGDSGGGDLSYVATGGSEGNIVVTDLRSLASDPRDKLVPVHRWEHHRAPVSSVVLAGKGGCMFSSDAAGMVMCYDILGADDNYVVGSGAKESFGGGGSGAGIGLRYGIGASSQGGVRALACAGGKLVAGGDDGNVLVFSY